MYIKPSFINLFAFIFISYNFSAFILISNIISVGAESSEMNGDKSDLIRC